MSALKVWLFIKGFLPWKKIGAYLLGVIGVVVAGVIGVSNTDLKDEYCKSAPVELPKIEAPAAPVAPVAPEKK